MENYIEVTINTSNAEEQEILIALLSNEGYDGFEEKETSLKACIPEAAFQKNRLDEVLDSFQLNYEQQVIAPRNWNAEWESGYQPVIVESFAAVRAHFHQPITNVTHELIITPKMSFGTGHHATTWQMMKLMQQIDFSNKRVFDATDIDDWCIDNTNENAVMNQCKHIAALQNDVPPAGKMYDIILANINRHILLQFMQQLSSILQPGGYLFISGFYAEENNLLLDEANKYWLQLLQSSARQNWSSLMLQKSNVS
jgi:ribosomal protein L11 methyltransferase